MHNDVNFKGMELMFKGKSVDKLVLNRDGAKESILTEDDQRIN